MTTHVKESILGIPVTDFQLKAGQYLTILGTYHILINDLQRSTYVITAQSPGETTHRETTETLTAENPTMELRGGLRSLQITRLD